MTTTTPIIPPFLLSPEAWIALGCLSVLAQLSATFGLSVAHGSFLTGLRVVSPTEDSLTAALNLKKKKKTTTTKKEKPSDGKGKTTDTKGKDARNGSGKAGDASPSPAPDEWEGKNGTTAEDANNTNGKKPPSSAIAAASGKKHQTRRQRKQSQKASSRPTDAATVGDRLAALEFSVTRVRRGQMMLFSTESGSVQTRTWHAFDSAAMYVACAAIGWISVWMGGLILRLYFAWGRDCDDDAAQPDVLRRVQARRENASPVLTLVTLAALYQSWSMGAVNAAYRRRRGSVGVGIASAAASLWLLHTPALLRVLHLASVTDGLEELSARLLLLGRLVGVVDARSDDDALMRLVSDASRLALSVLCGLLAANMAGPIRSTAEVATRAFQVGGGAEDVGGGLGAATGDASRTMTTMNKVLLRLRIVLLSILPLMHLLTYALPERRLSFLLGPSPSPRSMASLRMVLGWSFVLLSLSTIRPLLQTYLDEAVRDGAAELGVAGGGGGGDPVGGRVRAGFHGRLQGLVGTAARYSSLPMFVASLLVLAHLRGGGGGTFPPAHGASPEVPLSPPSTASTTMAGDGGAHPAKRASDDHPPRVEAFVPTPIYDSCQNAVSAWTGGHACPFIPPIQLGPPGQHDDDDGNDADADATTSSPLAVNPLRSPPPAISDESSVTLLGVLGDDLPHLASLARREPLARSVLLRGDGVRVEDAAVREEDRVTVREVAERLGRVRAAFRAIFAHRVLTPPVVSTLVEFVAFVLCCLWMTVSLRCLAGAVFGARVFGGGRRRGGAFAFHFADKEASNSTT